MSYEGLLDEVFGLDEGFIKMGADIGGNSRLRLPYMHGCTHSNCGNTGADGPVVRVLPAKDVYKDIRDLNLSEVLPVLQRALRSLSQTYEERNTQDSMIIA